MTSEDEVLPDLTDEEYKDMPTVSFAIDGDNVAFIRHSELEYYHEILNRTQSYMAAAHQTGAYITAMGAETAYSWMLERGGRVAHYDGTIRSISKAIEKVYGKAAGTKPSIQGSKIVNITETGETVHVNADGTLINRAICTCSGCTCKANGCVC